MELPMNLRRLLSLGFLLIAVGGCASATSPKSQSPHFPEPKLKQARQSLEKKTVRQHRALYPARSRRSLLLAHYPILRQTVRSGGTVRGATLEEVMRLVLPNTAITWGDISPDLPVTRSILPGETRYDALERILRPFGADIVPYPDHILVTRTVSMVFRVQVPNIRNLIMNNVGNGSGGTLGSGGMGGGMPGGGMTGGGMGMSGIGGGMPGGGMTGGMGGGMGMSGIGGGMPGGGMMGGMGGGMGQGSGSTGGTVSVTSFGGFSTLWDKMEITLRKTIPKAVVSADPKSQTVSVRGSVRDVYLAQRYLDIVRDQLRREVFFRITVAEIDLSDSNAYGINWSAMAKGVFNSTLGLSSGGATNAGLAATGGVATPYGATFGQTAVIQALETVGRVHVLNQPYVGTVSGQPVSLNATTNIPYLQGEYPFFAGGLSSATETIPQIAYAAVGVNLEVTPTLEGDQVHLHGTLVVNTLQQMVTINIKNIGEFQNPEINTRSETTEVTAKDGQTIVIGGLMANTKNKQFWTVPFLGSIPGLKWLFSGYNYQKQVTELAILITPEIRKTPTVGTITTEDLMNPDSPLYKQSLPGSSPLPVPDVPSVPGYKQGGF